MQQLGYRNSTSGPPGGGGGGNSYRPGQVVPPPYRAPPPGVPPGGSMFPGQQGGPLPPPPQQNQPNVPYSRLNMSDPSMATGSPVNYRHTINHEHGSQVQNNLKQMLNMPKHQTLDNQTQSAALHHLRTQGFSNQQQQQAGDNYSGPDSMRNAANKLFARSTNERNSMTFSGSGLPPGTPYSQHQSLNQSMNQSMEMTEPKTSLGQGRMRAPSPEDPSKRNSYANQSFRTALYSQNGQPQHQGQHNGPPQGGGGGHNQHSGPPQNQYGGQQGGGPPNQYGGGQQGGGGHNQHGGGVGHNQPGGHLGGHNHNTLHGSMQNVQGHTGLPKMPPQVPPKPGSRSASKDRSKEMSENSVLEKELNNILHNSQEPGGATGPSGTPPLPPLSPSQSNNLSPQSSPDFRMKYKSGTGDQQQRMTAPRPDLIQNESHQKTGKARGREERENNNNKRNQINDSQNRQLRPDQGAQGEDLASTVTGLDLESVIALQTDLTSDEELSTTIDLGDAQAIRRQLDGLENMYTEVLKLLGLRKFGRTPGGGDLKGGGGGPGGPPGRRKMYGSMSSLPSVSSIGSRHLYSKDKRRDDRRSRTTGKDKTYNKRFQRLESHVVTLARSVAHLSSEMRTQHALMQDIETIKGEIQQLKLRSGPGHTNSLPRGGVLDPQDFFNQHPRVSAQTEQRVKKLTKFFGDEPPLLRLYLKNLGYEKYASIFEEAKIGMLELPYLSEDRLEKLGIPLGPRIRILQEAKIPYNVDGQNYNVYIL